MPTVRYTVAQGEVIAEKRGGVRNLYTPDPLGSTAALIDNTQTITDTWVYWPYGEVKTRTGTTATPFQYVGPDRSIICPNKLTQTLNRGFAQTIPF